MILLKPSWSICSWDISHIFPHNHFRERSLVNFRPVSLCLDTHSDTQKVWIPCKTAKYTFYLIVSQGDFQQFSAKNADVSKKCWRQQKLRRHGWHFFLKNISYIIAQLPGKFQPTILQSKIAGGGVNLTPRDE